MAVWRYTALVTGLALTLTGCGSSEPPAHTASAKSTQEPVAAGSRPSATAAEPDPKPEPEPENEAPPPPTETLQADGWLIKHSRWLTTAQKNQTKRELWDYRSQPAGCEDFGSLGQIVSIVGDVVSSYQKTAGQCEASAHPWARTQLETVQLSTGKELRLTQVFGDSAVSKALAASPKLNLLRKRSDFDCLVDEAALDGAHFAFHALTAKSVIVRVGVGHGCESSRGRYTRLELSFAIPKAWRPRLVAARDAGTLMREMAPYGDGGG